MTNPRQALEEAWDTIARANGLAWASANAGRFCRFLDAEAWTDAAMMLIGPDRWLEFKGPRKYLNIPTPVPAAWSAHIAKWNHDGDVTGWGETLAEAIAAACLKARENSDG